MKALDRHGRRSENGCACICIHRRAGRPLQQIILEQVKSQLPDLLKAAEDILDQLTAGKTVQSVPPALNVIFRPSAQPYLISWLRYDPVKEIAKLHISHSDCAGYDRYTRGLRDPKALEGANPGRNELTRAFTICMPESRIRSKENQVIAESPASGPDTPTV